MNEGVTLITGKKKELCLLDNRNCIFIYFNYSYLIIEIAFDECKDKTHV